MGMDTYGRYALRCTVSECTWRVQVAGPDVTARCGFIRELLRLHADQKHSRVDHPTGVAANMDPDLIGDYAELML